MNELTNVEVMETAVETIVDNVPEDVVVEAGMSLGKKAGIVGLTIAAVGLVAYGVTKYIKKKKAKDVENIDEVVEEENFEEEND